MGREENSSPCLVLFFYNRKEFLLHERVQTAGWLIEDVKPGPVLESAHNGGLLAVPEGKFVRLLSGIQLKTFAESPGFSRAVHVAQACRKLQDL